MKRLLMIVSVFFGLIHSAFAQGLDLSPSAQTGRLPFAAYSDGDIDSVSIYNGNVSLDIPLRMLPGRELSTGLRLTYNSQKWQQFSFLGAPGGVYTGGWQIFDTIGEAPVFAPEYVSACADNGILVRLIATWTDGFGSKHPFTKTEVQPCDSVDYTNRTYDSENGDGAKLYTGNTADDVTIKFKDGTTLQFVSGGSPRVTTANGNYLERDANGLSPQDTLGRRPDMGRGIVFETDFDPNNDSQDYAYYKRYTVIDANGTARVYTLHFMDNHSAWNPW